MWKRTHKQLLNDECRYLASIENSRMKLACWKWLGMEVLKLVPGLKQLIEMKLHVTRLNHDHDAYHHMYSVLEQKVNDLGLKLERHSKVIATLIEHDPNQKVSRKDSTLSTYLETLESHGRTINTMQKVSLMQHDRINEVEDRCEAFINELDYIEGRTHLMLE